MKQLITPLLNGFISSCLVLISLWGMPIEFSYANEGSGFTTSSLKEIDTPNSDVFIRVQVNVLKQQLRYAMNRWQQRFEKDSIWLKERSYSSELLKRLNYTQQKIQAKFNALEQQLDRVALQNNDVTTEQLKAIQLELDAQKLSEKYVLERWLQEPFQKSVRPVIKTHQDIESWLTSNPFEKIQQAKGTPGNSLKGLNQTIADLAGSLNNNPVEIFNWVYNEIEYVPSYGVIQSPDYTLQTRRGNAYDIANLLKELFKAANIDTRYAYGTVRVSAESLQNWLGVDSVTAGLDLLNQGGISHELEILAGQIVGVLIEHIWLEVYVDMLPSRGAKNIEGDSWVALDASFKRGELITGFSLPEIIAFNTDPFVSNVTNQAQYGSDWISYLDANYLASELEDYQSALTTALNDQNLMDYTIAELLGGWHLLDQHTPVLPFGLPYAPIVKAGVMDELPPALVHQYRIALYENEVARSLDNSLIEFSDALANVADQRLSLRYIPATEADALILAEYLLDQPNLNQLEQELPGYLISVKPQFILGESIVAEGNPITFGQSALLEITHENPALGYQQTVFQSIAGEHRVIGWNLQGNLSQQLDQQTIYLTELITNLESQSPVVGNDITSQVLQTLLTGYFAAVDSYQQWLGTAFNYRPYRAPSFGSIYTWLEADMVFDIPQTVHLRGIGLNVADMRQQIAGMQESNVHRYLAQAGTVSSLLAEEVLKQAVSNDQTWSTSAIALLADSVANGEKVFQVNANNIDQVLPQLQLNETEQAVLTTLIAANHQVSLQKQLVQQSWQGRGWMIVDLETGRSNYDINGGVAQNQIHTGLVNHAEGALLNWLAWHDDEIPWALQELSIDTLYNAQTIGTGLVALSESPLQLGLSSGILGLLAATTISQEAGPNLPSIVDEHLWIGLIKDKIELGPLLDPIAPEVDFSASPLNVNVNETVNLTASATDNNAVTSLSVTVAGQPIELNNQGQGTWSSSQSGLFVARARARDAAGNVTNVEYEILVSDPQDSQYPEVSINSPEFSARVTEPVAINITVADNNLVSWELYQRSVSEENYQLIANGNNTLNNAEVAQFDPTLLLNGQYEFLLEALDANGQKSSINSTVSVEGQMKLGHFSIAFEDLTIPLGGIPITIIRGYDSRTRNSQGDFGHGWQLSYQSMMRLEENVVPGKKWEPVLAQIVPPTWCLVPLQGQRLVTVNLADGKTERFEFTLEEDCMEGAPPASGKAVFKPLEGTTSELIPENSEQQLYFSGGEIRYFDTLETYNPQIYYLTTAEGTEYTLDQNFGVSSIKRPSGESITITDNGIIHHSGESVEFKRDGTNNITEIIDPAGNSIHYNYNGQGELTSITDPLGNKTEFTYIASHYLQDIIDPRGIQVARNEYDDQGRLIAYVDADGNRIELTHDLEGNYQIVKDERGYITAYQYDSEGNIINETNALGEITTRTYDHNGNELTVTNPLGEATSKQYAVYNVISETDALGNTIEMTYSNRNMLLTQTNPYGDTVVSNVYYFDSLQNTTDALGNVTAFSYQDGSGQPTKIKDALGHETHYSYNSKGYLAQIINAQNTVTNYVYDASGNVKKETTQRTDNNNQIHLLTTQYVYDANNQLIETIDALGNSIKIEYNEVGAEKARIDADGNKTEFEYDSRGNLIKTIYPDGATELNGYDKAGNLITKTDRAGRTTTTEYDPLNRLIKTTYPDGTFTSQTYNAASRLVKTTNERGFTTSYTYDAAGRLITTTDALNNITSYGYDKIGNRTSMTDANGNVTEYEYDLSNNLIKTTYPDNTTELIAYDAKYRRIKFTDQSGFTTEFNYDEISNLVGVKDALDQLTQYIYDEQGNKTKQIDANNNTTKWNYNNIGEIISYTLPLGQTESYTYDANANLISKTNFNGETINYAYDTNNRLVQTIYPNNVAQTINYTPTGERLSVIDNSGTTNYEYDLRDRLLKEINPTGQMTYAYDAAGNRTSLTTGNQSVSYTYNALDQLQSVTDNQGTTQYAYDKVGNQFSVIYPNGIKTEYGYDALNRTTLIEYFNQNDELQNQFVYTLGPAGHRLKLEELSGRIVNYVYDDTYRLIEEDVVDPNFNDRNTAFTYDPVGNRLTQTENGALTTYIYNSNDQLLSETTNNQSITYNYDNIGNLINKNDNDLITSYTYNVANELIKIESNGETYHYAYNADGIRTNYQNANKNINYLVDSNQRHPQVIEEINQNDQTQILYTYGDDLIAQSQNNQSHYYQYDGLGSTRYLSDSNGNMDNAYIYKTFGELEHQQGATPNQYLFAGEQFDEQAELYYLRARYMNPAIGRFIRTDDWPGNELYPLSFNEYLYVLNDPINLIDPLGLTTLTEQSATLGAQSTLTTTNHLTFRVVLRKVGEELLCVAIEAAVEEIAVGIYVFIEGNGGFYVGKTNNFDKRLNQHKRRLSKLKDQAGKYIKETVGRFQFIGKKDELRLLEQFFMDFIDEQYGDLTNKVRAIAENPRSKNSQKLRKMLKKLDFCD